MITEQRRKIQRVAGYITAMLDLQKAGVLRFQRSHQYVADLRDMGAPIWIIKSVKEALFPESEQVFSTPVPKVTRILSDGDRMMRAKVKLPDNEVRRIWVEFELRRGEITRETLCITDRNDPLSLYGSKDVLTDVTITPLSTLTVHLAVYMIIGDIIASYPFCDDGPEVIQ